MLVAYKSEILAVASFIYIPFLAFIVSLAMVYLFGRMLGLVKKDTAKNTVAFVSMLAAYAFYFICINTEGTVEHKVWYAIIYTAISILLYVLIGFKLYNRVDALLDKVAVDSKRKH